MLPGIQPAERQRGREFIRRAREIAEVAMGVASQCTPDHVVKVVGPDAVEIPAAARAREHERVEIPTIFRVDEDLAIHGAAYGSGQLRHEWCLTAVDEGVCGIEAEAVGVVLADP